MDRVQQKADNRLEHLVIKAGVDKDGRPESRSITLCCGEVISVVGPTGSGKSQLLADIECLAQRDTPSKRVVLPNGRVPDDTVRFSGEYRLVAQLSQNMNFVMNLSVKEFLTMHAQSRLVENASQKVDDIYKSAVMLAGEPFSLNTPITSLSGGQSRALMTADVAYLSASPIVLIDEIENAGVDRQKAVSLLLNRDKMVLIATHDPLLALSKDRRIIIKNGGMADVLETTDQEKASVACLAVLDKKTGADQGDGPKRRTADFDQHYFFK